MELQTTWRITVRVWWAYIWRWLLTTIVMLILSFGVGALLQSVTRLLSLPAELMTSVGRVVGWMLGLSATIVPFRFILGKRYGGFRLIVVPAESTGGAARSSCPQAEHGTAPNGGPATPPGSSGVTEGPPSVS